jgi:hypothetical protein
MEKGNGTTNRSKNRTKRARHSTRAAVAGGEEQRGRRHFFILSNTTYNNKRLSPDGKKPSQASTSQSTPRTARLICSTREPPKRIVVRAYCGLSGHLEHAPHPCHPQSPSCFVDPHVGSLRPCLAVACPHASALASTARGGSLRQGLGTRSEASQPKSGLSRLPSSICPPICSHSAPSPLRPTWRRLPVRGSFVPR